MTHKKKTPHDFIVEHKRRGYSYEQILIAAQNKDNHFYSIVSNILSSQTLIEQLEQKEAQIQSEINFVSEEPFSSRVLKENLDAQKAIKKSKTDEIKSKRDGKANLNLNTDTIEDDLAAPLGNFKVQKVSFTSKFKKTKEPSNEQPLLFPEEDSNEKDKTMENKLKLFPETISEKPNNFETELTPLSKKIVAGINNQPLHREFIAIPLNENDCKYNRMSKDEIIKTIYQKEQTIAELNHSIGVKEQNAHISYQISIEDKKKLKEKLNILKAKNAYLKVGVLATICVFASSFFLFIAMQHEDTQEITITKQADIAQITANDKSNISTDPQESIETITSGTYTVDDSPEATSPYVATELHVSKKVESSKKVITHTVKKGENLWGITAKYLGKENGRLYKKVMKANGLTSETAPVGKTIRIPSIAQLEE